MNCIVATPVIKAKHQQTILENGAEGTKRT